MSPEEFHNKIHSGVFKNKVPYKEQGYLAEEARIHAEFEKDLFEAYGVTAHPKVRKVYSLAWEYGHHAGFSEVASHFSDLVELIKD